MPAFAASSRSVRRRRLRASARRSPSRWAPFFTAKGAVSPNWRGRGMLKPVGNDFGKVSVYQKVEEADSPENTEAHLIHPKVGFTRPRCGNLRRSAVEEVAGGPTHARRGRHRVAGG